MQAIEAERELDHQVIVEAQSAAMAFKVQLGNSEEKLESTYDELLVEAMRSQSRLQNFQQSVDLVL